MAFDNEAALEPVPAYTLRIFTEAMMAEKPNLKEPSLKGPSLKEPSFKEPSLKEPSLIMIQFLAWVADRPRNYAQAMDAWRSSCPRLSVWEDAIIEGLVRIESNANRTVRLTARGSALLARVQPQSVAEADLPRVKSPPRTPVAAQAAAF
jgi:hypothetical protein